MVEKKPTYKTAAKQKAEPPKVLSDKEIVKEKFRYARPEPLKGKFTILDKRDGKPIFSGLADTESAAWKRAAHAVL